MSSKHIIFTAAEETPNNEILENEETPGTRATRAKKHPYPPPDSNAMPKKEALIMYTKENDRKTAQRREEENDHPSKSKGRSIKNVEMNKQH